MEFKDSKAIYIQIADLICENVLNEQWGEDERIPSIREFAVSIEVNPNTVMRTYSFLQDEGIIYNKRGIGYFISKGALKKTLKMKKENFINNDLPYFFKYLELLNLRISDIEKLYKNFLHKEKNKNEKK